MFLFTFFYSHLAEILRSRQISVIEFFETRRVKLGEQSFLNGLNVASKYLFWKCVWSEFNKCSSNIVDSLLLFNSRCNCFAHIILMCFQCQQSHACFNRRNTYPLLYTLLFSSVLAILDHHL